MSDLNFFKELIFLSEVGSWSINMETGEVDGSIRFWELLGYEKGELEETLDNLKKIHFPSDWEEGWELISEHIKGHSPYYKYEVRYLRKDKSWLPCEVRGIVSERDEEGNPLRFIGYIRDISSEVALRKEIAAYRERDLDRREELETAKQTISELEGIVPICSSCKSIRNDEGYWKELEAYIESHSQAVFSHGLCDSCSEKLYKDKGWFQKFKKRLEEDKG